MAPFGREHREIERLRRLHLEPPLPAVPGLVRRVAGLGHDPFVSTPQGGVEKPLRRVARSSHGSRNHDPTGEDLGQRLKPPLLRLVEQRVPVQIEDVEEEWGERQLLPESVDVELAAETPHRGLERMRCSP